MVAGQQVHCLGRTQEPNAAVLREWMTYPMEILLHGQEPMGGWSPSRSQVVCWGSNCGEFYYIMSLTWSTGRSRCRGISISMLALQPWSPWRTSGSMG